MPELIPGTIGVVSGAASGIGLEIASQLLQGGLAVALLDVEERALSEAVGRLRGTASDGEARVVGLCCDVSSLAAVQSAAEEVRRAFAGRDVGFVAANAGVSAFSGLLEATEKDWDWQLGVNVKGVGYMMRTFVPLMQKQAITSTFCVTSSILGLVGGMPGYPGSVYSITKAAATALCEVLQKELDVVGSTNVFVHCLCPPLVATNVAASRRNRPAHLRDAHTDQSAAFEPDVVAHFKENGLPPSTIVTQMLANVREGHQYSLMDRSGNPDSSVGLPALISERAEKMVASHVVLEPGGPAGTARPARSPPSKL